MPSPSEGAEAHCARLGIGNNGAATASRPRVEEIQRGRILAAMVEVSREHGPGDATVARVVDRAGVSRRTFYELFEDREQCFLAALDEGIARASSCVLDAYDPDARWAERIRMALTALLSFLDVERGMGWLLVVGSLGAGTEALERRQRVLALITTVIDQARTERSTGSEPSPLTAEGVVGGVLSIIHARLLDKRQGRLIELLNPLMAMIVLPYLGPTAAHKEQQRPVPKHRASDARGSGDPLRDLEMRLTYRTVRVLLAIAAAPGTSNREIGDAAGISDQGQISKLLTRLERLELVQNTGSAPRQGAPNAWMLTEKGAEVERAMSAETSRSAMVTNGHQGARGGR
jgi:AcrR family transcriptional regulator/DNA-binding MarR family transcriptional regulator